MRILISGIIFSLLLACVASTASKTAPLIGDYVAYAPKMQVGDRWKLKVGDKVIEKKVTNVNENNGFTVRITHQISKFVDIEYDKNYIPVSKNTIEPKNQKWDTNNYIQFPLFVGKTYQTTFKSLSGMKGKMYEWTYDFRVVDVSRIEYLTQNIHVFTINFTKTRYVDPWSGTGKLFYSPELKSIIKVSPAWGDNSEVFAYHVIADKLQIIGQGGALQSLPDAENDGLLSFGYNNLDTDNATIALERKKLEEERIRLQREMQKLAKEQEISEKARRLEEQEASALRASKLAEAEKLAAQKLKAAELEAKRLTQEALTAAATKAEQLAEQKLREARLATESVSAAKREAEQLAARKRAEENNQYGIAVIIGNKSYAPYNADVPDVSYAHNDADAMYSYVKDTLGYQEGNIILLKDATQAELSTVFGNERSHKGKLFSWTQPNRSNIFVYYSGHGAPGLSDGTGYLLPVNADPMTVELNGYPLETLYTNLAKIPARQMTVVLDACFSGSSASGNLVKSASSIALRRVETKNALQTGAVFSAADVSEVASWDNERELGLFTANFLDGVRGAADQGEFGDGDGQIKLGELKKYLQTKVSYSARRNYYRDQHPQVSGDEEQIISTIQ